MSNEEVAKVANQGSDIMIPFASIDPAKGKMGAREARRLIKDYGVKGFKFRPQIQEFYPNDATRTCSTKQSREPDCLRCFTLDVRAWAPACAAARHPAQVRQPHVRRRRRSRLSRHADHPRASVVAVAGRSAVDLHAQAVGIYRLVWMVAQVLPTAA